MSDSYVIFPRSSRRLQISLCTGIPTQHPHEPHNKRSELLSTPTDLTNCISHADVTESIKLLWNRGWENAEVSGEKSLCRVFSSTKMNTPNFPVHCRARFLKIKFPSFLSLVSFRYPYILFFISSFISSFCSLYVSLFPNVAYPS
jgi:hypothetical protein